MDFGNKKSKKNGTSVFGAINILSRRIDEGFRLKMRCLATTIIRCISPFNIDGQNDTTKANSIYVTYSLYAILSFLLGYSCISPDIYPFGISVLCAVTGAKTTFAFIGCAIGTIFCRDLVAVRFISLFLLYLLRKTFTGDKFNEKLIVRVCESFFTCTFIATTKIFSGTNQNAVILPFLTYVILGTVCAYLFAPFFSSKKQKFPNSFLLLSLYSICVCLVPAFNRLSFGKVDLGFIYACVITLILSRVYGPIYGCVCGFIMGFACVNPMLSACLGMAGLFCGFLFTKSLFISSISFPIFTTIISIYIFGLSSSFDCIIHTCIATLIFFMFFKRTPEIFIIPKVSYNQKTAILPKKEDSFNKISNSLSGLSSILYKFAEHCKAPGSAETGDIFDNAFNEVCATCSMNNLCFSKRECNFEAVRDKVISILHTRTLNSEELYHMLLSKCIKTPELCEYINSHYSELNFLTMKANRTQTLACMYNSMSRLIKTTAKDEDEANVHDENLEKKITHALKKIKVEFSHVEVLGNRQKDIYVYDVKPEKIPLSSSELSKFISKECNLLIGEPTFDLSDSASMVMKLERKECISVEYAHCASSKDEKQVNGDTACFFDTENGYFYSIISDGMGSGKNAATTSRLSCVFLEKLLSSGTRKNVCLEMLNNLLLSKNDETFATVDILEIDKLNSSAYFIKAGAAPSFILRNSKLYKISSETPPVGIIHSFSAESTRFCLEKGDVIFMVSDGVVQSGDDAVWLSEIIRIDTENEPCLLASELIEKARVINERTDDTSVCIIKII